RQLDYCLMIEHHPDNVAAALVGGFVASYLIEVERPANIPASEVSQAEAADGGGGSPLAADGDGNGSKLLPPENIGHFLRLGCSPRIKAVVLIPDFELATAKARSVLPASYSTKDVVFNLQRLAVLTTALGQPNPDPWLIYRAMEDKLHQPYRKTLVPGLPEILATMNPSNTPGLLGVCLSGAGPTILALAADNFDEIGTRMKAL
ncbi:Trihydroxynaphthalene reductase, partial [Spiromyces aspiralis]